MGGVDSQATRARARARARAFIINILELVFLVGMVHWQICVTAWLRQFLLVCGFGIC